MTRLLFLATALVFSALSIGAASAAEAPPQGIVGLSASASLEVTKDVLSVTLSTTHEGADPAAVQAGLKKALDAALAQARKVAKPGQIDVQTGNFSLFPRHAPKGGITGWQGTAELQIEGRDIPGIAQLAGRLDTLSIARVATTLSREQRRKLESEVAAQAIASYRAKAADYARQFGYTGFLLREVNVSAQEPMAFMDRAMTMSKASMPMGDALPVEPGRGTVSVTVSGTVTLTP